MRIQSRKNPWRNTRRDFEMPWMKIGAFFLTLCIPVIFFLAVPNIVMRSGAFYSYFLSRTEIVREVPYSVETEDIVNTFSRFMQHRMETFNIREKSEYMPQMVFSPEDEHVMMFFRNALDIMAVVAFIMLMVCIAAVALMMKNKGSKRVFESYVKASYITAALIVLHSLVFFIKPVRKALFAGMFGTEFPPGDVLLQIFDASFAVYYGGAVIAVMLVLGAALFYVMKRFVASRKMFRW